MDEKTITKKEFDDAVVKAAASISDDETLSARSKLLLPMLGMFIALKLKEILFSEEKED